MTLSLLAFIVISPHDIIADLHRDGMPVILQTDVKAVIMNWVIEPETDKDRAQGSGLIDQID
jgi:hypothetical protein